MAGKGSPAALLMALLLAVLRTLVDEELEPEPLVARLNTQICRHSPGSRFITLFYGVYTPSTGALTYVNAGQNPPLLRRADGSIRAARRHRHRARHVRRLHATRRSRRGSTPARCWCSTATASPKRRIPTGSRSKKPGCRRSSTATRMNRRPQLGTHILKAVERYAQASRFTDDLTILILKRRALI